MCVKSTDSIAWNSGKKKQVLFKKNDIFLFLQFTCVSNQQTRLHGIVEKKCLKKSHFFLFTVLDPSSLIKLRVNLYNLRDYVVDTKVHVFLEKGLWPKY